LANGVPHRKPGPIQAVFGCLVYATDKQVLRTDTISNRSLAGVFMGLGHHARLDANCRSIKIFCLERSAIITADPPQCRFQIDSFPFRQMRLKSRHIDKMIRVRPIYSRGEPLNGQVIAFESAFVFDCFIRWASHTWTSGTSRKVDDCMGQAESEKPSYSYCCC
jgi:hypothetical protein